MRTATAHVGFCFYRWCGRLIDHDPVVCAAPPTRASAAGRSVVLLYGVAESDERAAKGV
jgi:hypothetical protein